MDLSRYIGLPYEGCWSLLRRMHWELFQNLLPEEYRLAEPEIVREFQRVDQPRFGDIIVFRSDLRHVGFVVDRTRMLHTTSDYGHSRIERFTTPEWSPKITALYRHRALMS